MVICPTCQSSCTPKARFCPKCGHKFDLGETSAPAGGTLATTVSGTGGGATTESQSIGSGAATTQDMLATPASPPSPAASQPPSPAVFRDDSVRVVKEDTRAPHIPEGAIPVTVDLDAIQRNAEEKLQGISPLDVPVALHLNFNRVFVAGYGCTFETRLVNRSGETLTDVEIAFRSTALEQPVTVLKRRLASSKEIAEPVEVDPIRGGSRLLQCEVSFRLGGCRHSYRGKRQFGVVTPPASGSIAISIGDVMANNADNAGMGGEIKNLVDLGKIETLNDLIKATLPDAFREVSLEKDFELSVAGEVVPQGALQIPREFYGAVSPAPRLALTPVEGWVGAGGTHRGIRLCAAPVFRIGRSREASDFLAWFWPVIGENKERTKLITREGHVQLALQGGRMFFEDPGAVNGSTFDGVPVVVRDSTNSEETGRSPVPDNMELKQRGTLLLANALQIDVNPIESTLENALLISNERSWSGPGPTPPSRRGCVRLEPENAEFALWIGLWVFTDATFGSSRHNALVLDLPGLPEKQGRFHFYRGQFWLEIFPGALPTAVGGRPIKPGEIVPLAPGQELQIGSLRYKVATVK